MTVDEEGDHEADMLQGPQCSTQEAHRDGSDLVFILAAGDNVACAWSMSG
jgi:hypothetical protein